MSLLVADLIQALSFVISFHWHSVRPVGSNHQLCVAQGVMIHLGDVASAFFVLAIALHTWYQVGLGRKLDDQSFNAVILTIWVASVLLTVIAPAAHGSGVYVASGAWVCATSSLSSILSNHSFSVGSTRSTKVFASELTMSSSSSLSLRVLPYTGYCSLNYAARGS